MLSLHSKSYINEKQLNEKLPADMASFVLIFSKDTKPCEVDLSGLSALVIHLLHGQGFTL